MKETISKVKRQPSEWETIIANEGTDKELISKIYKQLMQLNTRKLNEPIKNWAKELRYHLMLVRMAAIKKSTKYECWRGCGEKGTLLQCWWECKLVQLVWRMVWRFLKTWN